MVSSHARLWAQQPALADQTQLVLRGLISGSATPRLELDGQSFHASPLISCFYERRDFRPAWSTGGALRPAADELLAALATAEAEGLRAEDYRLPALQGRAAAVRSRPDARGLADLDLLLSDAFLTFGAHLRTGKVNPQAIYRDCAQKRDDTDLAAVLEGALAENQESGQIRSMLASLSPPHRGYKLLREAL
ncbi:MAG TPA: hypothetical protein VEP28_09705, partial [Rubrobacter sp.]|nr:hypothetical protein [Rubrobacter sp.]